MQEEGSTVYLRPETAQGIFLDFKTTLSYARKKPPFGIAQIGKSFRNEITPGNFIFRTLEFEQMEMEFFVPPEEAEQWYEYWCQERLNWYTRARHQPASTCACARTTPEELAHYSTGTSDVEYLYPIGWRELEGVANRGDFDLTQHAKFSREKLECKDPQTGKGYIPHVIEPAAGLGRTVLALLCDAYDRTRSAARSAPCCACTRASRRSRSPCCRCCARTATPRRRARSTRRCARGCRAEYDEGGNIGKRYRRQDEIGTPFGVTVDHQTLEDGTVTLRDRDTLTQERVPVDGLVEELESGASIGEARAPNRTRSPREGVTNRTFPRGPTR